MTTATERPVLRLVGEDGNAFAIMGRARAAARRAGWANERITELLENAMSGDYNHLLAVMTDNFDVR